MSASGGLRKYVVVREIPDIGSKSPSELGAVSSASCKALKEVGTDSVQWVQSYVVQNGTYCIYLATGEDAIRRHAEAGGFPITYIQEVCSIIDPTNATNA